MSGKSIQSPTASDKKDKIRTGINTVVAGIPVIGGSTVELLNAIVIPPKNARIDNWMDQITEMINALPESEDIATIERLKNDERFISILLAATNHAIQTHSQDKLGMLKNAVKNTATTKSIDEVTESLLLFSVGQLTVTHLKVLVFAANPTTGSARRVLLEQFPELGEDWTLVDQIWSDLFSRGLVLQADLAMSFNQNSRLNRVLSDLGVKLVKFVS